MYLIYLFVNKYVVNIYFYISVIYFGFMGNVCFCILVYFWDIIKVNLCKENFFVLNML